MPVTVKSYNKKLEKFLVQVDHSGMEKYVGKLSLLFNDEDVFKFKERLAICKARQHTAEDEIRFFKFVEGQPDALASTITSKVTFFIIFF